jgi:hydrogenase expression/formation protein HypD
MDELQKLRDPKLLRGLAGNLKSLKLSKPITLMEVCGTHTMAIHNAGLPGLLPPGLKLISGPGCPVCVTPSSYLDRAIAISIEHRVVLATFGDMMKVPGTSGNLSDLRNEGYPVEVVYSSLGAAELALREPEKEIVFLAVGFETTAPTIAATVKYAREKKISNFSILAAQKLVIPALKALVNDPELRIDGFILPGHVSVVLGSEPYRFIAEEHQRGCVITGFEPADIIQGILMLVEQVEKGEYGVEIQYGRVVHPNGNPKARAYIDEVFAPEDTVWRGFGMIPQSGLALRDEFASFDAFRRFPVTVQESPEPEGCRCGEVLRGLVEPPECSLFGNDCVPENPVGPCMVSTEGTCAAFYKSSRRPAELRG